MIYRLLLIIILLLYSIFIYSKDNTTDSIKLDVDTAVKKGLEHNFSLKNNKIDLNVDKLLLATSWNKFIPTTNFQTNLGKDTSIKSGFYTPTSIASIGFNTGITLNAKMIFDINQLAINWKNGLLTVSQAEFNLKNTIEKDYYNIVVLMKQLELLNKVLGNLKLRYDTALIQNRLGMLSETDTLRQEYAYKNQLYTNDQTNVTYQTALLTLKQIIGIKNNILVELTTDLPEIKPLDYDKILKAPVDKNLDIMLLVQSLVNEINNKNSAITVLTPSIGFSYSFNSQFDKDPFVDQWFLNTNEQWDRTSQLRFYLSFPLDVLFPFSSAQTSIIVEQAAVEKIRNNIQNTKEQTINNVVGYVLNLKQDETNINSLIVNSDIAEKVYNQAQQLYARGAESYLDLIDTENSWLTSKNQILSVQYDFLSNYLNLKYALNINDEGGKYEK